jgi:hypothetical protein
MAEVSVDLLNIVGVRYQALAARIQVDQYEVPANYAEEAAKTLSAYIDGGRYNPSFRFRLVDGAAKADLDVFQSELKDLPSPWLAPMRTTIDYMTKVLIDSRSHSASAISKRTTAMYGGIAPTHLEAAVAELEQSYTPSTEATDLDAHAAVALIEEALKRVSLSDWSAHVEAHMNAMMDVSAERRELRIRQGTRFSLTGITRLLVHEVGCHVFRAASGMRQPIQLLGFSLGDYLPTEEGLACYQEQQTGLSDPVDSRRLALRYYAAALSFEQPLSGVYAELRRYTDHEQAFETAARAKRGIADTSQPGAHLKDKVYFEGLRAVSEHLAMHPADLTLLYTGKISLSMLPLVRESLARGDLIQPAYDQHSIANLLSEVQGR